jgi:hypothetical protein
VTAVRRTLLVHRLGRVEYEDGLALMRIAGDAVVDRPDERLTRRPMRAPIHSKLAARRSFETLVTAT